MDSKIIEFINWAKRNNWSIIEKKEKNLCLETDIISRYKVIPSEYVELLKRIKQMIAPNEKAWFICEDEYNDKSEIVFKWNEFELISLEAVKDDDEWKSEIISWWNEKLPIFLSVNDGYSFYAIDLSNNKGSIVKGYEPEFEETEEVASSFEEFLELIMLNKIKI